MGEEPVSLRDIAEAGIRQRRIIVSCESGKAALKLEMSNFQTH